MKRIVFAYVTGVAVAFVIGSVIGTQMVLHSVQSMGLAVRWSSRISTTAADILGLSSSLLPLMALCLVMGWAIFDLLSRRVSLCRYPGCYALVGATCIMALHPLLNGLFGVDVFAPARTVTGVIAQGMAGAVGGFCFATVRFSERLPSNSPEGSEIACHSSGIRSTQKTH